MIKPAVCIATIRPQEFKKWLAAWAEEFTRENVHLHVMVDGENQELLEEVMQQIPIGLDIKMAYHDHRQAAADLGDKAWIIPKRTSACKSYAIYKAWKAGCDPIMVLDDDCLPDEPWVERHIANLKHTLINHVWNTLANMAARGTPRIPAKPMGLSHGTWKVNPDIDAISSLEYVTTPEGKSNNGCIPLGALFPMSGMNLAFRHEIAPLMYFGLQGPLWGVDRFDDIWCGFLAKKVLDYLGYAVWSGTPYVRHIKASDPFVNIVKEAPGYKMNVELYQWAMGIRLMDDTGPVPALREIASAMRLWPDGNGASDYWRSYGRAILEWLTLFEPPEAFGI